MPGYLHVGGMLHADGRHYSAVTARVKKTVSCVLAYNNWENFFVKTKRQSIHVMREELAAKPSI